MDLILTESQFIKLLKEQQEEEIAGIFEKSRDFTKKFLKDVKKQFGIDFTFLLTWGSVIGGFVGPISNYMEDRYSNLSESDITLICFGITLTFFSSNKEKLHKVLEIIKEKKLITFFDRAMIKSYELRDAMFNFLDSLNITFSKVSNMIAYTFLIPLVPLLKDISDLDLSEQQVNLIVTGVSHYTGGIFTSNLLTTLIDKIIKRFKD
jgi:hypothetical protein